MSRREKAGLAFFVAWVVAIVGAFVGFRPFTSDPAPSPIHVANVFADGVNHFDFRQACSVLAHRQGVRQCEIFFTVNVAQSAFFGGMDTYRVVPHSQKVWTERLCQGHRTAANGPNEEGEYCWGYRYVKLAVVKLSYSKEAPPLEVHLRFVDGAWQIWWIG